METLHFKRAEDGLRKSSFSLWFASCYGLISAAAAALFPTDLLLLRSFDELRHDLRVGAASLNVRRRIGEWAAEAVKLVSEDREQSSAKLACARTGQSSSDRPTAAAR